jgi:putative oxidoreductase
MRLTSALWLKRALSCDNNFTIIDLLTRMTVMTILISNSTSQRAGWITSAAVIAARFSALPLRLIVGYGFVAHGFAKLSRGPETFAAVLHVLGVPVPFLLAWVTTLVELVGGTAILLGAFVPIVSIPMAIVLITAMMTVHWPYGFFSVKLAEVSETGVRFGTVGYEIILLYLAGLTSLVLGGAGPISVDAWRARLK